MSEIPPSEDITTIVATLHRDWVSREEQYRSTVSELASAAAAANSEVQRLNFEVLDLRRRLSTPTSTESDTAATVSVNETVEILEYIECSYRECLSTIGTLSKQQAEAQIAAVSYWELLQAVALPLAHHTITRTVADGTGDAALHSWHTRVVDPIHSLLSSPTEGQLESVTRSLFEAGCQNPSLLQCWLAPATVNYLTPEKEL